MEEEKLKVELRENIIKLLDAIQPSRFAPKGEAKNALRVFAQYFFEENAARTQSLIEEDDCFLLLQGHIQHHDQWKHGNNNLQQKKIGLIQRCGNTKGLTGNGELKWSTVMCLKLLSKLLNPNHNSVADKFQTILSLISKNENNNNSNSSIFDLMRLDLHVIQERGNSSIAFEVLSHIERCYENNQNDKIIAILLHHNSNVISRYLKYKMENQVLLDGLNVQHQKNDFDDIDSSEVEETLVRWSQVDLDQFEDELQVENELQVEATGGVAVNLSTISEDDETVVVDPSSSTRSSSNASKLLDQLAQLSFAHRQRSTSSIVSRRRNWSLLQLDPLGITSTTSIRNEKFRKKQFEQNEILSTHSNFNPIIFLSQVHSNTSYSSLASGLRRLQAVVDNRAEQLRSLVREHFDQFIHARETLDTIHLMLKTEVSSASHSASLEQGFTSLHNTSLSLFQPLLDRTAEVERIQNILRTLKRYQILFSLPSSVERNIRNRHLDKVVIEYKIFKSIKIPPSQGSGGGNDGVGGDNSVLQHVYDEVFQLFRELRFNLLQKLESSNINLQEQKNNIKILMELDCWQDEDEERTRDPSLFYLMLQHQRISVLMKRCYNEYQDYLKSINKNTNDILSTEIDHAKRRVIFRLSRVLLNNIESFWKLVSKKEQESQQQSQQQHSDVGNLIISVIEDYSKYVRSILLPNGFHKPTTRYIYHVDNIEEGMKMYREKGQPVTFSPFTQSNIITILNIHEFIRQIHLPERFLLSLYNLINDITFFFIRGIWMRCLYRVSILFCEETWMTHKNISGITLLPLDFSSIVIETLDSILSLSLSNVNIGTVTNNISWLFDMVAPPFLEVLKAFADSLHILAFEPHLANPIFGNENGGGQKYDNGSTMSHTSRNLLAIFSNVIYSKEIIIPQLWQHFLLLFPSLSSFNKSKIEFESISSEYDNILTLYDTLRMLLITEYVRRKVAILNKYIKQGLFLDLNNKASNDNMFNHPRGELRSYMYRLLLELVFVYQETFHSSGILQTKLVLEAITEMTTVFFCDMIQQCNVFDINSAEQIFLEINFFKYILSKYLTSVALMNLEKLPTSILLSKFSDINHSNEMEEFVKQNINNSKLLFACFEFD